MITLTDKAVSNGLDTDDLMAMSWEALQPVTEGRFLGVFISYQAKGRLSWGIDAHAAMGQPDRVELVINRSKKAIGLRPVKSGGFAVTTYKSSPTTRSIQCKKTLKRNGIHVETPFRHEFVKMGTTVYVVAPEIF